jgi:endoglucanase
MKRRSFLKTAAGAAALTSAAPILPAFAAGAQTPRLRSSRWRGFNLLEKFVSRKSGNPPFQESDFVLMNEWGFDFARLPMSYLAGRMATPRIG